MCFKFLNCLIAIILDYKYSLTYNDICFFGRDLSNVDIIIFQLGNFVLGDLKLITSINEILNSLFIRIW